MTKECDFAHDGNSSNDRQLTIQEAAEYLDIEISLFMKTGYAKLIKHVPPKCQETIDMVALKELVERNSGAVVYSIRHAPTINKATQRGKASPDNSSGQATTFITIPTRNNKAEVIELTRPRGEDYNVATERIAALEEMVDRKFDAAVSSLCPDEGIDEIIARRVIVKDRLSGLRQTLVRALSFADKKGKDQAYNLISLMTWETMLWCQQTYDFIEFTSDKISMALINDGFRKANALIDSLNIAESEKLKIKQKLSETEQELKKEREHNREKLNRILEDTADIKARQIAQDKKLEGVPPLVEEARDETVKVSRLSDTIIKQMGKMSEEERTVYFGNADGKTQARLANELKCSIDHIRYLAKKINKKLQSTGRPQMTWNNRNIKRDRGKPIDEYSQPE
ncbi:MAG: hypothetical protein VB042_10525 [Victivallaceae bacterium]|nr:hypothetical protein [Victivallaceae bacterium]